MAAMMAREYGIGFMDYLADEPSRTHAYHAAACENAGMIGETYVDHEIRLLLPKIMSGEIDY